MFSVSKVGRKKRKEGRKEKKGKRKEGRKKGREKRKKEGREGRKKKIDFFYRRKKELEGPGLKLSCCWLPEEGLLHPVPPPHSPRQGRVPVDGGGGGGT